MGEINRDVNKKEGIREKLDKILIDKKNEKNIKNDCDLSTLDLKGLCGVFKNEILN